MHVPAWDHEILVNHQPHDCMQANGKLDLYDAKGMSSGEWDSDPDNFSESDGSQFEEEPGSDDSSENEDWMLEISYQSAGPQHRSGILMSPDNCHIAAQHSRCAYACKDAHILQDDDMCAPMSSCVPQSGDDPQWI